ncbi:MAG TPA: hypothetical protein VFI49_08160 [Rudaea sp.]|nr:hypothetical protein [Rudaea sp.]
MPTAVEMLIANYQALREELIELRSMHLADNVLIMFASQDGAWPRQGARRD